MTLPVSPNAISMSQVDVELGYASTATISLNDAAVRSLFGKASGTISLSDGWGKSSTFVYSLTVSTNTSSSCLVNAYAINAGWNGSSKLNATITINSGIYQGGSSSVGNGSLTVNSTPAGSSVVVTNNGYIFGGNAQRLAVLATGAFTFYNYGVIAAGGGDGGRGGDCVALDKMGTIVAYGGAGGNGGSYGASYGPAVNGQNGATGGYTGTMTAYRRPGDGGVGGTGYSSTGGTGGNALDQGGSDSKWYGAAGGGGGGGGAAGTGGTGGNGVAISGYTYTLGSAGTGPGAAVNGNSYITWGATGTRYGAIS